MKAVQDCSKMVGRHHPYLSIVQQYILLCILRLDLFYKSVCESAKATTQSQNRVKG